MTPIDARGTALDRVALKMTSTLSLHEVLTSVTSGLVEELGVALARVWLIEEREAALRLRASSGLSTRLDGSYARVPVGSFKIGNIAKAGEPVWTNEAAVDPRIADHAWVRANGLRSFAGWPLRFHGRLLGVLATFARQPLSDAELARLALFANQAAIAIENARLFAEVRALEERLEAENAYLRREVSGEDEASALLSDSAGLEDVLRDLRRVASTSTTVLLQGETGTGKELLARAVHEWSPRRRSALVRVNCAALSPTLIESELFGHEKGAFTGATQRRIGRFELADGGTLFLDEVGEVPLETQAKLLRVLQEREIERVGGARPVKVDARIVAATNKDLGAGDRGGPFPRGPLLPPGGLPDRGPPLRARPGDILPLAERFLAAHAKRLGKGLTGIDEEARRKLVGYAWPGNVRELANVVERAAIVAEGSEITAKDLPPLAPVAEGPPEPAGRDDGDPRLSAVVRAHVLRVLERTGGMIEGKAGAADVGPPRRRCQAGHGWLALASMPPARHS